MLQNMDLGQESRPESPTRSRVRDRSGNAEGKEPKEAKPRKKHRVLRNLLITLSVLILLVAAVAGGMVFGYVMLGKQSMHDIWEWSTWKHVYDLVFAP